MTFTRKGLPGPYRVDSQMGTPVVCSHRDILAYLDSAAFKGLMFCFATGPTTSVIECAKSTAALLAAAWDMQEALIKVVEADWHGKDCTDPPNCTCYVKDCIEALKKAGVEIDDEPQA